jgi:geranylgeranyl diphosphate synthase type I
MVLDMDPKELMYNYKIKVEEELQKIFKERKENLEHWTSREACEILEEYTLRGGKRIRAILMIVGYKMMGGKDEEAIIRASTSLELIQSYLLIHDDIMDESDLRRGKATVHKIYEDKHLKMGFGGKPKKFGESMAIILGDLADAYAMQILASSDFPPELKVRAIDKLNEIIEYTGYGQIIDIYSGVLEDFKEEDLLLLHKYKTARYTIEGPLALGIILAGKDPEGIEKFAIPVGIAFQLQDDILGLFGNEEELGKPVTSDLAEGKKTLLIIKALEKGDNEDRRVILEALGNPAVTYEQLEMVREVVRRTGSLDYSRNLAEKLVREAKEALLSMEIVDEEMREFLLWLSDYMIKRKY